jgi:type I restriction enzyme S subunit
MGSEWTPTIVGSFCPFAYGKGLPEKKRNTNGNIKVYGSNGPVGVHDQALVDEPGIVIGRKGTVGAVHFASEPFWPIDTTFYVVGEDNRDLRFTYYLLKSIGLEYMNADSAVPGLNRDAAHSRQIVVPEYLEQRAIAHILGSLDDKIELNRKMNETLEAMARAIFKSWFVDFDPVHARRGEPMCSPTKGADTQVCPYMTPEILNLFPDSFEDSELGEIPKGWRPSTIGSEFNLTMGQSPPGKTYNETGDGLPFFQGRRDFGFRFPTNRVYCTLPKRLADHGDTLVSVRAPVGDINMATARCCIGRGVAGIRHKSGSRSYTYYAMHTLSDRFARFEAEGTVFGAINKKQFEDLRWLSSPGDLVNKFEKIAFPLDEQIEKNILETATLASLRDTLLPKLISGELRVPDAEGFLEGAF